MINQTDYFDELYKNNDDPWEYEQRWYERRKRQICLSLLLKSQYDNVLEIGCSNGVFSEQLARRAKHLTSLDANAKAVQIAQKRLDSLPHVQVIQKRIPEQFPAGSFDLIVISEIMYYLQPSELSELIHKVENGLTPQGKVLCCHWRYPIEGFALKGEDVHQVLRQQFSLNHYLNLNDPDFIIDLWSKDSTTLAAKEGLL
ncbi:class I SAM-dependent methyltransferase [Acinetobacter sp.]|uniref:class I SAM-dependent methyltransferase n=1 Tax=Acinetobacter sp. TaxID=472 RepID=UPI0028AB1D9C|nr:class I SAM-dependent methyltransferase [Acinetobacter sp.]